MEYICIYLRTTVLTPQLHAVQVLLLFVDEFDYQDKMAFVADVLDNDEVPSFLACSPYRARVCVCMYVRACVRVCVYGRVRATTVDSHVRYRDTHVGPDNLRTPVLHGLRT